MENEKTIVLTTPVTIGDKEYTQITLREPRAGDVADATDMGGGSYRQDIRLISLISKTPQTVINQMSLREFAEARNFIVGFTSGDQVTGES